MGRRRRNTDYRHHEYRKRGEYTKRDLAIEHLPSLLVTRRPGNLACASTEGALDLGSDGVSPGEAGPLPTPERSARPVTCRRHPGARPSASRGYRRRRSGGGVSVARHGTTQDRLYAEMVEADRQLRLCGYEGHRFGDAEFWIRTEHPQSFTISLSFYSGSIRSTRILERRHEHPSLGRVAGRALVARYREARRVIARQHAPSALAGAGRRTLGATTVSSRSREPLPPPAGRPSPVSWQAAAVSARVPHRRQVSTHCDPFRCFRVAEFR